MAEQLIYRFVIDVLYERRGWVLRARGFRVLTKTRKPFDCQKLAIDQAAEVCRELEYYLDLPCQLVIHGKDGRIKSERTYGEDPPGRKG